MGGRARENSDMARGKENTDARARDGKVSERQDVGIVLVIGWFRDFYLLFKRITYSFLNGHQTIR